MPTEPTGKGQDPRLPPVLGSTCRTVLLKTVGRASGSTTIYQIPQVTTKSTRAHRDRGAYSPMGLHLDLGGTHITSGAGLASRAGRPSSPITKVKPGSCTLITC